MKRLFTPFEQESVAAGQKFGGTGLGMAITRNLVMLMGGTILREKRIGEGDCFLGGTGL